MARTRLTPTATGPGGVIEPAEINGDPANDHVIANDGRTICRIRNSNTTTAFEVVVHIPGTVDGLALPDHTISMAALEVREFGPWSSAYNQPGSSDVHIDVNSIDLKIIPLRLPAV